MADYLLDTNILAYWYHVNRPEHQNVVAAIQIVCQPDQPTHYVPRLFVSAITIGEIEYGHRVQVNADAEKQAEYRRFVRKQCPEVLELTQHVAEQYGVLKAWVFNYCAPKNKRSKTKRAEELVDPSTGKELGIDENDLWIAAQAWTHNLVLVTHDRRGNFGKLLKQFAADLKVVDWAS